MIILRLIGRFFARIGRWIRDTAWVQPLLIVGGIFALIFSIPSITKWVSSWFEDDETDVMDFYEKYELTLSGANTKTSYADNLIQYLEARSEGTASEADKKTYGDKMFITFFAEGCSGCESNYDGFNYLKKNWGKTEFKDLKDDEFRLYSINAVEFDSDLEKDLFKDYFYENNIDFFQIVSGHTGTAYYDNQGGDGSSYATSLTNVYEAFETPTTVFIDFTDIGCDEYGISEVFFTIEDTNVGSSSDNYSKARTMRDCWTHKGIFSYEYKK